MYSRAGAQYAPPDRSDEAFNRHFGTASILISPNILIYHFVSHVL